MIKKNTKNRSEYGIHMLLEKMMLVQQNDLDIVNQSGYFDENSSCHIYFICKRARVSLATEKVKIRTETIELTFNIHKENKIECISFTLENPTKDPNAKIISEYPYNLFSLKSKGELISTAKTSLFLQTLRNEELDFEYLDFEILYIGQSFGSEGEKTAPERLKSHSTLQGIYAEALMNNPDSEIWIALVYMEEMGIMQMGGNENDSPEDTKQDIDRLVDFHMKIYNRELNQKQKINFTEAALIKYFEPPYNIEYKKTFPNPSHKSYQECYDLDVNSISIELKTREMVNLDFYSKKIPRKKVHMESFFLQDEKARRNIFKFDYSTIRK